MELEFFASCLSGLETLVADELKTFGITRVRPLKGGVAFFCAASKALYACLWSRLASRILLVLDRVNAGDAALLYAGIYDLPWEDIFAEDATFAVRAHGSNAELRNTRFTALKAKDAIMDRLRSRRQVVPTVDTQVPRASVDIRIHHNKATVSLDFSGEALNHRSYLLPDDSREAPFECSLAAAALAFGRWSGDVARSAALVDPVCRSGVLAIEAASIACNRAPGLGRTRWGFFGWAAFDESCWLSLVNDATRYFEEGLKAFGISEERQKDTASIIDSTMVRFVGMSTSSPSIAQARKRVRKAGLRLAVSIEIGDREAAPFVVKRAIQAVRNQNSSSLPLYKDTDKEEYLAIDKCSVNCVIASNLKSLSRQDAQANLQADEAAFIEACRATMGQPLFIVLEGSDISSHFDSSAAKHFVLGKGRSETFIDVYTAEPRSPKTIEIPDVDGGASHKIEVYESSSDQFAARLKKVFKERRKWAKREGVSCFRIYDSDLSDYAVAIDWYSGAGNAQGNNYLSIAEYAPPASVDENRAKRRFDDVLAIAPVVCGIRPDHVFSKRRVREKGGSQYRKAQGRSYITTVEENGYLLEVDLAKRLDTGLFLDHRMTRQLIGELASKTRFLNLFAYTGVASVYAAAAGAASTVTVDLSQTYLDWAARNMKANGFSGANHNFVRADVLKWVTEARRKKERFDLIFVDPPTFSNSKAMGKKTWDVQRDHSELLIGVSRLLSEDGQAIFSCNLRSFKPDIQKLEHYGVKLEDISLQTIPYDFSRTPKIHKCYRLTRQRI